MESLQRLRIDRIDIAHTHDVIELVGGISHIDEAIYPVLAELREHGTISAIGVGAQVNRVLIELGEAADFDCFLVASPYTMLDQSALDEVLSDQREKEHLGRYRESLQLGDNHWRVGHVRRPAFNNRGSLLEL